jgi:hypothetical protein
MALAAYNSRFSDFRKITPASFFALSYKTGRPAGGILRKPLLLVFLQASLTKLSGLAERLNEQHSSSNSFGRRGDGFQQ